MFNPLPAIALLPLSLLWFGLGNASLVFVIVHLAHGAEYLVWLYERAGDAENDRA
jgi:ABC-type nitrate/sulfonate/bicarbonate transport system permease component